MTSATDPMVLWTEQIVREAGDISRHAVQRDIDTELKGGDIRDLVTEHDRKIDRFLTDAISSRFPGHGFITEEHEHPAIGHDTPVWIIDPIDGTTNFVTMRSYFAVSVAHYIGNRPVFGIVYDVMADDLFLGIAGGGAYLNGQPLAGFVGPRRIEECVVEASSLATHRLANWFGADAAVLATGVRAQRALGCASIGICRLAQGRLDVYVSSSLSIWDYAAALVVLDEAGGAAAIIGPPGSTTDDSQPFHLDRHAFFGSGHPDTLSEFLDLYLPPGTPDPTRLTRS